MRRLTVFLALAGCAVPTAPAAAREYVPDFGSSQLEVVFGQSLTLHGAVSEPGQHTVEPRSETQIRIEGDPFPYEGKYRPVETVTTRNQTFDVAVSPQRSTRYRATVIDDGRSSKLTVVVELPIALRFKSLSQEQDVRATQIHPTVRISARGPRNVLAHQLVFAYRSRDQASSNRRVGRARLRMVGRTRARATMRMTTPSPRIDDSIEVCLKPTSSDQGYRFVDIPGHEPFPARRRCGRAHL